MDVRFINPFIKAAFRVLESELGTQVERSPVELRRSAVTTKDVTVALGVTGEVRGAVLYEFSEQTAKSIVSSLLGQPVVIFDELAESAIAEIGNVITGLATAGLEDSGYSCKIAPPTVISGRGVLISTLDFHRLVVTLKTQHGEIDVNVALKAANLV